MASSLSSIKGGHSPSSDRRFVTTFSTSPIIIFPSEIPNELTLISWDFAGDGGAEALAGIDTEFTTDGGGAEFHDGKAGGSAVARLAGREAFAVILYFEENSGPGLREENSDFAGA